MTFSFDDAVRMAVTAKTRAVADRGIGTDVALTVVAVSTAEMVTVGLAPLTKTPEVVCRAVSLIVASSAADSATVLSDTYQVDTATMTADEVMWVHQPGNAVAAFGAGDPRVVEAMTVSWANRDSGRRMILPYRIPSRTVEWTPPKEASAVTEWDDALRSGFTADGSPSPRARAAMFTELLRSLRGCGCVVTVSRNQRPEEFTVDPRTLNSRRN